jgi:peroxiredoxin
MIYYQLFFSLFLLSTSIYAQESKQGFRDAEKVKGIELGLPAPDINALDQNNKQFKLYEALKDSAVVIIFYRGQWCPVCNKHLSGIQDSLSFINKQAAKVIAISPEKPALIEETISKTQVGFTLLYDKDYKIGIDYNILFMPKAVKRSMYNLIGANLKQAHSDESQRLAVPATFIIDKKGKIVWKHVDPDYKIRASALQILNHLPKADN